MRFFSRADLLHRQAGGGRRAVRQHVHALIDPFARQRRGDIGLVLVVGLQDLDRAAEHGPADILDRQFGGDMVARSADIPVWPAHVAEQADPHWLGGALGTNDAGHRQRGRRDAAQQQAA